MAEELLHYRNLPLRLEMLEPYTQEDTVSKPRGLWVSDGTAWKDWCESENYDPSDVVGGERGLELAHVVELYQDARILRLESSEEILRFTEAYATFDKFSREWGPYQLDWEAVASAYSGILIMPYQWDLRLSRATPWYYGWDVSSGCIWEPTAIASIRTLCPGAPHEGHASSDWSCPYAPVEWA